MAAEELVLNVKSDIGDVVKQTEKLDSATKKGKKGFQGIGTAVKGVGLALKAAGIGIIVALLAKLMEVFSSNQSVVNTFKTAMTSLTIAFNDLFNYIADNIGAVQGYFKTLFEDPIPSIESMGTAIKEHITGRFKALLEWYKVLAETTMNFWSGKFPEALESAKKALLILPDIFTGVDDTINKVKNTLENAIPTVTQYTKGVWGQAAALTEAQLAAQLAEVQFAKLNAENLRDAEIQRQIRDDVSKTFAVRIAANEKLSEILKKQSADQEAQLQIQLTAAKLLHEADETNIENQLALSRAEVAMLELQETITGQKSEQLTNQIALEEELRLGKEQSLAEGMSGMERELEELKTAYEEKKRLAIKSGVDTTAITKTYEKQKAQVVAAGVSAQLGAYSSLTGALGKLAGDNKELAVATAVMDTYAAANSVLKDPTLVGPARWASAAAVIITGLANVRSIMQTQLPGGGGGGGGGSAPAAPAPQMMSGAFDISGGVAPEPLEAYVLTDSMTNSQNQLANIRRRATI
jgi:hypothetical protein